MFIAVIAKFVKNECRYYEIFKFEFKFLTRDLKNLLKWKIINKKRFFKIVVITRFFITKSLKFEVEFVISDLENLGICSNSTKDDRKNDPDRYLIVIISIPIDLDLFRFRSHFRPDQKPIIYTSFNHKSAEKLQLPGNFDNFQRIIGFFL